MVNLFVRERGGSGQFVCKGERGGSGQFVCKGEGEVVNLCVREREGGSGQFVCKGEREGRSGQFVCKGEREGESGQFVCKGERSGIGVVEIGHQMLLQHGKFDKSMYLSKSLIYPEQGPSRNYR